MLFTSRGEKRLWLAAGLCIFLIYSSLYLARPVAEFLRQQNLLRLTVTLVFVSTGSLIGWRLLVGRPGWRVMCTVGAIMIAYLVLLTTIPMAPEERLHFLEYGLVAALVYRALRERHSQSAERGSGARDPLLWLPPAVTALILTGIVGWVDEGIQAVLPNRVYDLRDIAFNLTAAFVCLSSIKLVEWARGANSGRSRTYSS
jgi:pimeloyl-ACP methyl ester carboxylesterase